MEFTELIGVAKDFLTGNWLGASLILAPFVLPNKVVRGTGKTIGVTVSTFLGQKAGKKNGEKVEAYFQGSISAFVDGLNDGLDADDK